MRNFLYSTESYAGLPKAVHQAARGDWSMFSKLAVNYAIGIRTLDFGLFLSVTCSEDIPLMNVEKARADARGTLLGSYRIEQQTQACQAWVRGTPDPLRVQPVVSSVPTLLISGEFDHPRLSGEDHAGSVEERIRG